MHPGAAILLGCSLAVDGAIVALAFGLAPGAHRMRHAVAVGGTFGVAHAVTTWAGWAVGGEVAGWLDDYDHWVAFAVLAGLGVRALLEARPTHSQEPRELSVATVLLAAAATSLDGAAVGFGLALANGPIEWVATSAALATAIAASAAFWLGRRVPPASKRLAHVVAGVLLIGVGVSIAGGGLSS